MEEQDDFLKETRSTFTNQSPFEAPPETHNEAISQNTKWICENSSLSMSYKILRGNVDLIHNESVIITDMDIKTKKKR